MGECLGCFGRGLGLGECRVMEAGLEMEASGCGCQWPMTNGNERDQELTPSQGRFASKMIFFPSCTNNSRPLSLRRRTKFATKNNTPSIPVG
jgi:hypothetical protein